MSAIGAQEDWIERFPGLARLEEPARRMLAAESRRVRLPRGTRLFGPGQSPETFVLLLEGAIRVQQTGGNGREIVLYRVSEGESCPLTTACLMGYDAYPAEAVAETDIDAIATPRATFDQLIARSELFRRFVFTAFSRRFTDLFRIIEEIAFARMDIRLAQRLLELAKGGERVLATHQELASELGTAREVVSRLLHELQRRGWVAAVRGEITILDEPSLRALASVT